MPYTKQTWVNGIDGGTPLTATRLNYMEEGIETAQETAESGSGASLALGTDGINFPSIEIWTEANQTITSGTTARVTSFTAEDTYEATGLFQRATLTPYSLANGCIRILEEGLYMISWEVDWDDDSLTAGYRVSSLRGYTGGTGYSPGMYGYFHHNAIAGALLAYDPWQYGVETVRVTSANLPVELYLEVWQNSGSSTDISFAELRAYKLF